jgi:hypothetical protein
MTSEERIVIDTLISISKSLNKIAGEISAIRRELSENKIKKSAVNNNTWVSNETISESNSNAFVLPSGKSTAFYEKSKKAKKNIDNKPAVENIRDILNGEYIK